MPVAALDGRIFRHSMGLRPLDLANWFHVDAEGDAQRRYKSELLSTRTSDVVALLPEGLVASAELYELIRTDYLGRTRSELSPLAEHPLIASSRLVADDLCILTESEEWRLTAAVVCFPSRGRLSEKIGQNLDVIHAPVPGYDEHLAKPTNAFFRRLTPDKPFWRLNWTLMNQAELFQPTSLREAGPRDVRQWTFRVERQTLRKLPETGAVVFAIRTFRETAENMHQHDPAFATHVAAILESAPPETVSYKGWIGLADRWRDAFFEEH